MNSPKREQAKDLLVWYFDQAMRAVRNDRELSDGAHEEIRAIVDLIIDATVEEILQRGQ